MNKQENLIDFVADVIVDRKAKDSLQEKLVNMSVLYGDIGITWLNKDGSFFIEQFKLNENDGIDYTNHTSTISI